MRPCKNMATSQPYPSNSSLETSERFEGMRFRDQLIALLLVDVPCPVDKQVRMPGRFETHRQIDALGERIAAVAENGRNARAEVSQRPFQRVQIESTGFAHRNALRGTHPPQDAVVRAGAAAKNQVPAIGEMNIA